MSFPNEDVLHVVVEIGNEGTKENRCTTTSRGGWDSLRFRVTDVWGRKPTGPHVSNTKSPDFRQSEPLWRTSTQVNVQYLIQYRRSALRVFDKRASPELACSRRS